MKKIFLVMILCMVARELTGIDAFALIQGLLTCVYEVLFVLLKGITGIIA